MYSKLASSNSSWLYSHKKFERMKASFICFCNMLLKPCAPEPSDTGRNSPATVSLVSTQTDGSKPETAAEVKPEINFKLYAPHDRIMLIPASVPDYDQGLANGDVLFYLLSDDMSQVVKQVR